MNILKALQDWYRSQCDGTWEHSRGVKIDTLDNPGWSVEIELSATPLEGRPFAAIKRDRTEEDWVYCSVEKNVYKGRGGPTNLEELLEVFLTWAQAEP